MLKAIFYFSSRKSKWHIFYKSLICFTNTSERVYWMKGMETSPENKIIWWISWAKLINQKRWIALEIKNVLHKWGSLVGFSPWGHEESQAHTQVKSLNSARGYTVENSLPSSLVPWSLSKRQSLFSVYYVSFQRCSL